jgi:Fe-S-cluster containining protein
LTAEHDCQRCGACCVNWFGYEGYVDLQPEEAATMRRLGLPVIPDPEGLDQLGTQPHGAPGGETICAAFAGAVGGPCSCSVYPDRPGRCRSFEPGGLKCRAARFEAGLGPDPLADVLAKMAAIKDT